MAVSPRQSRRFGRSSPVTRYWLANCVGFGVKGGARGTVEAVLADGQPHEVETIVVRSPGHRVHRLPASAVVAVIPGERLLLVDRAPGRIEVGGLRAGRVAGRAAGRGSVAGARLAARLSVASWVLARRGWRVGSPVAAAWLAQAWAASVALARIAAAEAGPLSRRAWVESLRLIRSVPWHRFGPSVRFATTRLSQVLSSGSSRLRTTLSRPPSESDSAGEAGTTSST